MEGVKRIILLKSDDKRIVKRAPISYENLLKFLEKAEVTVGKTIEVSFGNDKGKISNQRTYENWLNKSGFHGLVLHSSEGNKNNQIVNKTENLQKPDTTKEKFLKTENKNSIPFKRNRKVSSEKLVKKAKISEVKKVEVPLKSSKKAIKQPKKITNEVQPSSIYRPIPSLFSANKNISPQTQGSTSLISSPAKDSLNSGLNSPKVMNPLTTFGTIISDGTVALINQTTLEKHTINSTHAKYSSRILMTDEGLLVTGGKITPYQAFLINKEYEIVNLVSM